MNETLVAVVVQLDEPGVVNYVIQPAGSGVPSIFEVSSILETVENGLVVVVQSRETSSNGISPLRLWE